MKIFNFDEAKKARIAAARAKTLQMMRAALIVAVAIVSGCLIVAYCGEAIIAVGLWLVHVAVLAALGFAIGSIAYALSVKLIELVWKPAAEIMVPAGWN